MDNYSFGSKIRERRQSLGISQEQLALRAGMTTPYLGQIERGRGNITVKLLVRLAAVLDVDIGYFFEDRPPRRPSMIESSILFALDGLSEEEKAAAKLRQLEAENRRLQMENDFLKKLNELEGRR